MIWLNWDKQLADRGWGYQFLWWWVTFYQMRIYVKKVWLDGDKICTISYADVENRKWTPFVFCWFRVKRYHV